MTLIYTENVIKQGKIVFMQNYFTRTEQYVSNIDGGRFPKQNLILSMSG